MSADPAAAIIAALALALVATAAAALATWLWRAEKRRATDLRRRLDGALRRAEAATEAREAFFDLATHELRSPLSAILGYQELLADGAFGGLDDQAAEPVVRIGRSARHLLHLIEGVVELSRLRSGDVRPDLGPVNLDLALHGAGEAFRTLATERGIEPRVRLPDGLPTIRSDQDRLVRALDMIVTSAVKHPASDTISLHVEPLDHGATLAIDGAEIPVRVDTDDPALRLGLRLAVASRLARLLNGHLRLEPPDAPVIRRLVLTVVDADAPAPPAFDDP